ncbi:hypothetical protein LX15_003230 [Streptoalloteichus tenebrarius]|uniref:Molecular chaperone Hsp90 n=1 Tax=Streptoalloteichus tenebrarius (strain ATCC 17920 / DSM 40477 / JCM 4838 / CBS 697.72 / NBRC 16177 / NCIMB 11028 / NRRL B-12390 / A12253. 1 / ISP 5477) TaxID=1933 RepID=A0ABT1HVI5_STRSD|nr:hypothetical protein [Streptoalloteichus tenebrarius]MCP2259525.1 hypothetical protein [Streptoalloteichus tenebrarius]BFF01394.1 molecular chaperone Hsp90 [Streptoalloteichus tenebrarius]
MTADPFGTAALRGAVLDAWRGSPTRFREDANAEEDLHFGGYRDRLLVELAQNAADAAAHAGERERGRVRLAVVDGELRVANTGAPLDAAGVAALASLRASAKRESGTVGRFGVGFAAVLAATDAPRIVSTGGGVAFSAERTRAEVAGVPELADELAGRGGAVPVLRLVWPVEPGEPPPPEGFTTEVRLPLRQDVDADALLASCAEQAGDLLLALPALERIEVADRVWWREGELDTGRVVVHDGEDATRWLVLRRHGRLAEPALSGLATEARERPEWTVCWAVPVGGDDDPRPVTEDVLHAPTPTDERLSLPARLVATLPVEPSRRRLLPGPATDAVLDAAAAAYPDLVLATPAGRRTALVPLPDFPLSEVDGVLRGRVLEELRRAEWLPAATGERLLAPSVARVLDAPVDELAPLLAEVVPELVAPEFSAPAHARALTALGVPRLTPAEVAAALAGLDREPAWWARVYAALLTWVEADPSAREELGALPVPLVDGRVVTGPRDVLLPEADRAALDALSGQSTVDYPGFGAPDLGGLRVAHPDAAHPLLERLGARRAGPAELLEALREPVERGVDDAEAGVDAAPLTETVLLLADRAGLRPGELPWLSALAMTDADGEVCRADELVLPGSALLDVLAEDAPLRELSEEYARRWPASLLTAVGVLDRFPLLVDETPGGPDHDLADEEEWWASRPTPPERLVAVRDLDLVAEDAWPAALRLLAADPDTRRALREPGYTTWWLARHARLAGRPPRHWRLPGADDLAGLYEVIPPGSAADLDPAVLVAAGVRERLAVADAEDAADLVRRLGDPDRLVAPGVALRAHTALAQAVADRVVDPAEVDPPDRVRTLTGAAVPADDAVVLDVPWLLGVLDPGRVVAGGRAESLAELLDLPLAADEVVGEVRGAGRELDWSDLDGVADACGLTGRALPEDPLVVHERLVVRVADGDVAVPWWVDDDGVLHAVEDPTGLSRALAWALGRWDDRHLLAALLADPHGPSPVTYLG